MPMSNVLVDREWQKFKETQDGFASVRFSAADTGSLLEGVSYDDVQVTFPTSTTENYQYFKNTVLIATIELTYQDASKSVLTRARRL